jgi:hypothetical protein
VWWRVYVSSWGVMIGIVRLITCTSSGWNSLYCGLSCESQSVGFLWKSLFGRPHLLVWIRATLGVSTTYLGVWIIHHLLPLVPAQPRLAKCCDHDYRHIRLVIGRGNPTRKGLSHSGAAPPRLSTSSPISFLELQHLTTSPPCREIRCTTPRC